MTLLNSVKTSSARTEVVNYVGPFKNVFGVTTTVLPGVTVDIKIFLSPSTPSANVKVVPVDAFI